MSLDIKYWLKQSEGGQMKPVRIMVNLQVIFITFMRNNLHDLPIRFNMYMYINSSK